MFGQVKTYLNISQYTAKQWYILLGICFMLYALSHAFFVLVLPATILLVTTLTRIWAEIWIRFFCHKKSIVDYVYGLFTSIYLLTIGTGIAITYAYISEFVFIIIGAVVCLLSGLLLRTIKTSKQKEKVYRSKVLFKKRNWPFLLFAIVTILALISMVPGDGLISTPWQIFSVALQYMVFALFILAGYLIYSQWSFRYILLIIMALSLVMHLQFARGHVLPWGGDAWRMMGAEQRVLDGGVIEPVLFGSDIHMRIIGGIAIPEVFLIPHKYTYAHMWGSAVFFAKHLNLSLEEVHIWLLPIMWIIVVPILLYQIGILLFASRRTALLLAWAGLIPYTFQVLGSITLPNSLGFISWLWMMSIALRLVRKKEFIFHPLMILALLSGIFTYSLYTALFWFTCIAMYVYNKSKDTVLFAWILGTGIAIAILFFPLIDVLMKTTYLSPDISLVYAIKSLIGGSSGLFLATAISEHNTLAWNILFNHTPTGSFVSSVFTVFRWHIFLVTVVSIIVATYGLYNILVYKQKAIPQKLLMMMFIAIIVVGGYVFGWHILQGDRTFVRRLDPLVGFVSIVFMLIGYVTIQTTYLKTISIQTKRIVYLAVIIIFSWYGTTVYALGSDMRTLSAKEYRAAQNVSSMAEYDDCVIADTWILLGVEYMTAGHIVGGNFPITYQFGQDERVAIVKNIMDSDKDLDMIARELFSFYDFPSCYVVIDSTKISEGRIDQLLDVFGLPTTRGAQHSIWQIHRVDFKSDLE